MWHKLWVALMLRSVVRWYSNHLFSFFSPFHLVEYLINATFGNIFGYQTLVLKYWELIGKIF